MNAFLPHVYVHILCFLSALFCLFVSFTLLCSTGSSDETIKNHLNEFATRGLRTLLLAKRHLSEASLQTFLVCWNEAQNAMVGRADLLWKAAAMIESDFIILGATAIEDKLQDNGTSCCLIILVMPLINSEYHVLTTKVIY
jgi:hypothetical protein